MHNNRDWFLRFIEGTDGAQAGGEAAAEDSQDTTPADEVSADDQTSSGADAATEALDRHVDNVTGGERTRQKAARDAEGTSEPPSDDAQADKQRIEEMTSRMERLQEQVEELTKAREEAVARERAALADEVAKAAGLPEGTGARLQGTTREDLEADATKLARLFGSRAVDPAQGQGGGAIKRAAPSIDSSVRTRLAEAGLTD